MADEENLLAPFRDDFGILVEAGFVATKRFDEKSAVALFEAAHALDPESPAPFVGLGYIELNKLALKRASKKFRQALDIDPEHHLAKAFLGITYLIAEEKREEGQKLLDEALKATDDPTIIGLVNTSLEWAEKDLIKKKAPFFEGASAEEKTDV